MQRELFRLTACLLPCFVYYIFINSILINQVSIVSYKHTRELTQRYVAVPPKVYRENPSTTSTKLHTLLIFAVTIVTIKAAGFVIFRLVSSVQWLSKAVTHLSTNHTLLHCLTAYTDQLHYTEHKPTNVYDSTGTHARTGPFIFPYTNDSEKTTLNRTVH